MRNQILLLSQEDNQEDQQEQQENQPAEQSTEQSDSGSQKEQEITIYAEIGNPEGLSKAISVEEHIQAEIKINPKRRMRVRKTTSSTNDVTYDLTTKLLCDSQDGVRSFIETTKEITPEIFEMFLGIVESYQHKKRYCFQIEKMTVQSEDNEKSLDVEDFKYEVDVFFNKEGTPSVWCKIDVEIQDLQKQMTDLGFDVDTFNINVAASKLPFEPSNFILMDETTSEEDKNKISEIYDKQFLTFNEQ